MDIVIVYHTKDYKTLPYCLDGLKHVRDVRNVYCISNEECPHYVPESLAPFSKADVESYVGVPRAGWYYQQLLKVYAGQIIPELSETYLVVDADTVFLNDVSFITDDGIPQYAFSWEHHYPYFEHMQRVIPGLTKQVQQSGICHHMVLQQTYIREIMESVERMHGVPFWKSMLQHVDPSHHALSGMSEYELYFNYMLKHHPSKVTIRGLRWTNSLDIPMYIEKTVLNIIEEYKPTLDYVSFHSWSY